MAQLKALCTCHAVVIDIAPEPIATAICYCADCQRAGRLLEARPGAPSLLRSDGGTDVVILRKDRVSVGAGADLLAEHRLDDTTPTRRVIATCCNTPMFTDFTPGFWVSLYRERLDNQPESAKPPLRAHSLPFMLTLVRAWLRMGLRRPQLPPYPRVE